MSSRSKASRQTCSVGGPMGSTLTFDRSSDDLQGSTGELKGPRMSRGKLRGPRGPVGLLGDPMMGSTGRFDRSSDDLSAYSPIHIFVI